MCENGDGEEPWSDDELFDLDSALSFGGSFEEIAIFLRREVAEVQRRISERTLPNYARPVPLAPNNPIDPVDSPDFQKRPSAPSVRDENLNRSARGNGP